MLSFPKDISFKEKPFEYVDNIQIVFHGNNLNFYQKYLRLAKTAFWLAFVSFVSWVFFGFDSTPLQWIHVLFALPQLVLGQVSFSQLHILYDSFYGKEMHYSAFVIYGLMYYFLSKHYNNEGIKGSKNVAYSTAIMLFAVSLFEWYWMGSYAYFQNQWWVITPQMPQLRIILQNTAFLVAGSLGILYMWADSFILNKQKEIIKRVYHFHWNLTAILLVEVSVLVALVWWFYPFPVESLNVVYETSEVWQNTRFFPQTLYTIDINPQDTVNAGVWYYVGNDLIHAWNTLVKLIWSLTVFYIAKVKPN